MERQIGWNRLRQAKPLPGRAVARVGVALDVAPCGGAALIRHRRIEAADHAGVSIREGVRQFLDHRLAFGVR